jgi:hypothetical protein
MLISRFIQKTIREEERHQMNDFSATKKFWGETVDFGQMTVIIENHFHHTQARLWVNGEDMTVQAGEVDRIAAELCGIDSCFCQSVPVSGNSVVDVEGNSWEVV